MARTPLDRLRKLCLALPETTERLSHGEPSWFVQGKKRRGSGGSADRSPQEPEPARATKLFVTLADHHHDDRLGFWCAAPPGTQEELVATDPEHYFRPPYVGSRGWIGVYLDVPVDWDEVSDVVEDAYRMVAPKRLVAGLDASE